MPFQISLWGSVLLGCSNKWAIIYIRQSLWGYLVLILICLMFAPIQNKKVTLTNKKCMVYRVVSSMIVCMGLFLYCKIGSVEFTSTIFFACLCVSILILIAQLQRYINQILRNDCCIL